MLVLGVLGFVVLFMVVRPLVRRIITPDERAVAALPPGAAAGDALAFDPAGAPLAAIDSGPPLKPEVSQTSKMIALAQVQGQVHAQSVQRVGEIADKNPS